LRLPFFIAAFALTLAVGVFALAGRGGQVVAQEPDPCMTEEPAEEPTTEPTVEPTAEGTASATDGTPASATEEDTAADEIVLAQEPADEESSDAEALQEECDDASANESQSGAVPDPRNFPTVGGRVEPLPPAAQVETSSPARAEADAARAAAAAAAQQPAALPSTGMSPGERSAGLDEGVAVAIALLGLGGAAAVAGARAR
jgi:hypothetical protein